MAVDECFVEVNKTSPMPNGGVKLIDDYILSRYGKYVGGGKIGALRNHYIPCH